MTNSLHRDPMVAGHPLAERVQYIFQQIGLEAAHYQGSGDITSYSPIDGSVLGSVKTAKDSQVQQAIADAYGEFLHWRTIPAPKRGELIRLFGEQLRENKHLLGELVTMECGKILQEGLGEVQEMIDICDFAVGLSRQLYGLTIASERPQHRMMETWHPLGVIGLITPFNFPVAVWAWNFALAIVCGNTTVWKPSEKTPLTALACQHLFEKALRHFGEPKRKLSLLLFGRKEVGEALVMSPKIPLISATGSTAMGRDVAQKVGGRFGRTILELGGNNGMIVTPSANLDLAVRAITFAAVGTAGQRCTSLRRLMVHSSLKNELLERLKKIYTNIRIGNPLDSHTLCGPLIDQQSYDKMQHTLKQAAQEGGVVHGGQRVLTSEYPDSFYVQPALVEMSGQTSVVLEETFAPILYVFAYDSLEQAIQWNNDAPQGLSSCIFTDNMREAEWFLSASGSDCGIANVNIGPSGAEIGGAFGGEKETGGGRESGSDSWRNYMRRATNTINYSTELPLAQGIHFDV